MKTRKLFFLLTGFLFLGRFATYAVDWSTVVDLEGTWYFSVGDDPAWASPKTDVSGWDKIQVPANWDDYYPGYNGYGWYRKNFDMRAYPEGGKLHLLLGKVDDVDEVFINGVKIGQTGGFTPDYFSAYSIDRNYPIPDGLLKPTENVIAVRVYDEGRHGGILSGDPIGIVYDNDTELIEFDLSGPWKFSVYREKNIHEAAFDDSDWAVIEVPAYWDAQGFAHHDGSAWYRKSFSLPSKLKGKNLFLSLGRIDDYDKVYLNGRLIARTEDLKVYDRISRSQAYRMFRVYDLPEDLLQPMNVLVVEVYDEQQYGGMYEGPVGLLTRENAEILEERNDDIFWGGSVRSIFRSIFRW
ncbi:MAG TPA: beta galactosidase jelly roll domain-containing protein [Prolixibacteraceae bacterium]|nr:beta galactosidase jelly roll domain-containing protein [Prolixibacteraceae bacterium]